MSKLKIFKYLKQSKQLSVGLFLLIFLILIALFGPLFCKNEPYFLYDDMLSPPSFQYPFGTDGVGCDIFTMVIYGTRTSLKIGVIVALMSCVIGVIVGGISGYFGGIADKIICEFLNIFMMVPSFFLIVLAMAIFGRSINNMIIIMALTSWMGSARLMRGQTIAIKEKNFIKNAEIIGESKLSIIFKHIVPNSVFTIVIDLSMTISGAILSEAGLSFLGMGDPNTVSWGKIIALGRRYLPKCWWISTFPGIAIIITALAFYLIGDGFNKIVNGKLKYIS
ncbi:MAG: ABC transporter permease [Oscillospiraceae bacterium]